MWVKVEKWNTFNKMKPQDDCCREKCFQCFQVFIEAGTQAEWHLGRVLNSHDENNSFTRAELQYWKL